MRQYQVVYNPFAGNGRGKEEAQRLRELVTDGQLRFNDITTIKSYADFFVGFGVGDVLLIAGGDGTLNRFLNDTAGLSLPCSVYYYAAGSGNDFWSDLGRKKGDAPVCIDAYIKELPTVEVNGKTHLVLNGVGYGIDGYCCEVGDRLRQTSDKTVNYTSIAIKGLLFHFKPVNAVITVDGKRRSYRKVWLAPTMNGRFYGGGMMPTPAQDRADPVHTISTMVMHGSGKLRTLMIFPSIFKGEHVRHRDTVEVLTGHDITIEFDRPTALQIDGETILGVTRCRTRSFAPVREAVEA